MEDIAGKIELYHNLFLGCLVICIICAVIAVVIFFILDIRSVVGYLTGKQAKKQIQKLKEINESSGRLFRKSRNTMQYVDKQMKEDMGVHGAAAPGARKVAHVVQPVETESLKTEQEAAEYLRPQTAGGPEAEGSENTSLLQPEKERSAHADTAASGADENATAALDVGSGVLGTFRLEREIILIHTEEVI